MQLFHWQLVHCTLKDDYLTPIIKFSKYAKHSIYCQKCSSRNNLAISKYITSRYKHAHAETLFRNIPITGTHTLLRTQRQRTLKNNSRQTIKWWSAIQLGFIAPSVEAGISTICLFELSLSIDLMTTTPDWFFLCLARHIASRCHNTFLQLQTNKITICHLQKINMFFTGT